MNFLPHARKLGMLPCKFKLIFVDVESADSYFFFEVDFHSSLFFYFIENVSVNVFPVKIIEISVHSRRNVAGDERGFYGYRSRSAKNVRKRS